MEALTPLPASDGLDLILHSPGGSAEATEALVSYIRSKFADFRVLIPHAAMSAATMLSTSSNRISMGRQSSIGPIDPQFTVTGEGGVARSSPAQAILDQFSLAKKECRDRNNLAAWVPMLTQYGPALLVQCEESLKLSREQDPKLEDLVLSVFHSMSLTFMGTPTMKLIENHLGNAWVRAVQINIVQAVRPPAGKPTMPLPPPGGVPTGEPSQTPSEIGPISTP